MAEPGPQEQAEQSGGLDARRISPAVAVAASILVAAIAGLSIGHAAQPEPVDPVTARQQATAQAGKVTLTKVRRDTARQGYRDGRKLGNRQGRRSGKAVGQADGQIQARVIIARSAQSAADSAEAALAEISEPPPSPSP